MENGNTASTKPVYTARVSVTGGREGHALSDDGRLDLALSRPGTDARGVNPEQLFAAAHAACFQSALNSVARQHGLDASQSVVESSVSLRRGDGRFVLGVALRIAVPNLSLDQIRDLATLADQACPYANAIRGNVDVTFEIANEKDVNRPA